MGSLGYIGFLKASVRHIDRNTHFLLIRLEGRVWGIRLQRSGILGGALGFGV